ncbi:MAG: CHAD domain-containing protein [Hyphomicrobiales bacterium]|nr:CHAD domain-containing protein [Hyphomicrobiales bacterium]
MSLAVVQQSVPSAGELLRRAISAALSDIAAFVELPAPTPQDVHLARRTAKRVRALARIAPARLERLARQTTRAAAEARKAFGQARDAEVRRATLASLRGDLPDRAHDALARCSNADAPAARAADHAALSARLSALARDWRLCDADAPATEILAAAARVYRRARRRMKKARSGQPRDLHRWRTAVADHEYVADFLAASSRAAKRQGERADRLRKSLGDLNDLHELAVWFGARPLDGEANEAALRSLDLAVGRRRKKLRRIALRRGARLYACRPKAWRRKVTRDVSRNTGSRDRPRTRRARQDRPGPATRRREA